MNGLVRFAREQSFHPRWYGAFVNPFFIARRGLAGAIGELAPKLRGRLLDDCAQQMFQQPVRVGFLSKRVECVSGRLQLATRQTFRRAQRFGRLLPFNGDGRQVRHLFDGVLMLRSWGARFAAVDSEDSQ